MDRYGAQLILIIGTLIFGVGFFVFSIVQSITSYFIAFILIALGSSLGGFATLMVAIVSWFDQHRAKAIAWSGRILHRWFVRTFSRAGAGVFRLARHGCILASLC